jgi:hypothetical protein
MKEGATYLWVALKFPCRRIDRTANHDQKNDYHLMPIPVAGLRRWGMDFVAVHNFNLQKTDLIRREVLFDL